MSSTANRSGPTGVSRARGWPRGRAEDRRSPGWPTQMWIFASFSSPDRTPGGPLSSSSSLPPNPSSSKEFVPGASALGFLLQMATEETRPPASGLQNGKQRRRRGQPCRCQHHCLHFKRPPFGALLPSALFALFLHQFMAISPILALSTSSSNGSTTPSSAQAEFRKDQIEAIFPEDAMSLKLSLTNASTPQSAHSRQKRQWGGGGGWQGVQQQQQCPPQCFACPPMHCQAYQCIQPQVMNMMRCCCRPAMIVQQGPDLKTACDGEEAVAACMNGLCGQGYFCNSRKFCCRCAAGKSAGTCLNGLCPAGYACNSNNYCCAIGAGSVLGPCANGKCPEGYECGAGELCYARSGMATISSSTQRTLLRRNYPAIPPRRNRPRWTTTRMTKGRRRQRTRWGAGDRDQFGDDWQERMEAQLAGWE